MEMKFLSISFCDNDGAYPTITNMVMVDGKKWEIATTNCYFTKCGNMTMVTFDVGGDGSKP
jgi:hypothetical protein